MRQEGVQPVFSVITSNAFDRLFAAAPGAERKPERPQSGNGRLGKHAGAQKTHPQAGGRMKTLQLPDLSPLLTDIIQKMPVQQHDGKRDIFRHPLGNAGFNHAHQR